MTLDEKICTKCGIEQPLKNFSRTKRIKSGRCSKCKTCVSIYWEDYYQKNHERIDAKNEFHRKANWEHVKKLTYARRDPLKHKARQAVNNALTLGKFSKDSCRQCSDTHAEFHHTNGYEQENWFVGEWLCRKHHAELHRQERSMAR